MATVVGFYLISKVFRPEFEARRIEHRTGPDRIAQTGQHSTAWHRIWKLPDMDSY